MKPETLSPEDKAYLERLASLPRKEQRRLFFQLLSECVSADDDAFRQKVVMLEAAESIVWPLKE